MFRWVELEGIADDWAANTGAEVWFFGETLSALYQNLPSYIIYQTPMQTLVVTPPAYHLQNARYHAYFKQITWYFRREHLCLVYFRYQMHFLKFFWLHPISAVSLIDIKGVFKSISSIRSLYAFKQINQTKPNQTKWFAYRYTVLSIPIKY